MFLAIPQTWAWRSTLQPLLVEKWNNDMKINKLNEMLKKIYKFSEAK